MTNSYVIYDMTHSYLTEDRPSLSRGVFMCIHVLMYMCIYV